MISTPNERKALERASKFMSLVLRHNPDAASLKLDRAGWAVITDLLVGMRAARHDISRSQLEEIVRTDEKGRYSISPDGRRIRANQGHSLEVDLGLAPAEPPDLLYHGTVARYLDAIRAEGLKPMSRQQVHLSIDVTTATVVASRRGKPVILPILAGQMHRAGSIFYRSENGVWLINAVPTRFIDWEGLQYTTLDGDA